MTVLMHAAMDHDGMEAQPMVDVMEDVVGMDDGKEDCNARWKKQVWI